MSIDSKKAEGCLFAIIVMIVILSFVAAEGDELFQGYLLADDGYWVAMPMIGHPQIVQNYQLFHDAIFWLSYFRSVPLLRVSLIVAHAVSAGVLYLILRQANIEKGPSAVASVFSVTLPVFTFQHLFISASHMIAGLPFLLLGVFAISKLSHERGRKKWIWIACSIIFLAVAARVSPLYTLAPLVAPAGLIISGVSKSFLKNALAFALVLGLSGAELYLRLRYQPHVYAKAPGWADVSFSHVIENASEAIGIVTGRVGDHSAVASISFLLGTLTVATAVWLSVGKDRRAWQGWVRLCSFSGTGMLLLAASALVFGPASVVSAFQDRYSLVPAILGFAAIGCFLRPLLNAAQPVRKLIVCGLGLMIISNLIGIRAAQQVAASGLESSHAWLQQAVSAGKADWAPESQIVVFLPETGRSLAGAFPHFSTGYVRLLAGRQDLFALVGKASEADAWPFVEEQNLFGSGTGYWIKTGGKVMRARMVGLREDRPLYVYAPGSDGRPKLVERVMFASEKLLTAEAGERVVARPAGSAKALCDQAVSGGTALWPFLENEQEVETAPEAPALFDSARGSGGAEKHWNLSVPTGARIDIAFNIEGAATDAMPADTRKSKSYPPIPLLAPFLAIYQIPGGYRIEDRITKRSHWSRAPDGRTSIGISGLEGCGFSLTVDNMSRGMLGARQISGDWLWAPGFEDNDRHGRVLGLNIRRDGVPISP